MLSYERLLYPNGLTISKNQRYNFIKKRGKAHYTIIKILIKITYNSYNTRIYYNINIYTIIDKCCTLLYKIIRENATIIVNNL